MSYGTYYVDDYSGTDYATLLAGYFAIEWNFG
ncbi:hypothetical protein SAMN05720472_2139 [Fibrobacter sp. UWR3]|jgi:hypothetical protein|nr:hypothetical protein SAMN05720472_2139 [Fibrobacter sp. UWR3]SOE57773.1 hypothetical protein SAMN05720781_1325 [Fibrobacter sp. UWT3]